MLIYPAFAQAGGAGGGNMILQFLPLVAIFVIFYFLLIRPQQKRQKEHRTMVSNVKRGDGVITAGGIKGKVTKVVDDYEVKVEIAEGVIVSLVKSTITDVINKTEPRGTEDKK